MKILIEQIIFTILRFFSQKEGEKEISANESFPSVHAPKWLVPVMILCELLFGGFAFFSYLWDVKIAIPFFIAFCLFGIFAFAYDGTFRISVDGQEIRVTRLFKGTRNFLTSDIVSARKDNAGAVIVSFGTEEVKIDCTMVNKDWFFDFAHGWAYRNADAHIRQRYTIRREKMEIVIPALCALFLGGIAAYMIYNWEDLGGWQGKIAAPIFIFVLFALSLFWFLLNFGSAITVDEARRRFSYRKGFFKKSADFSQIQSLKTKKRLLESAVNYILTVENAGKTDKIKIISLDENSDRFVNLLQKSWESEDF